MSEIESIHLEIDSMKCAKESIKSEIESMNPEIDAVHSEIASLQCAKDTNELEMDTIISKTALPLLETRKRE